MGHTYSITGMATPIGSQRSTCWSITINNPLQEDIDATQNAQGHLWFKSFEGQNEIGENGTKHIQGMLTTTSQKFSVIKKAFQRAHIEVAKNKTALQKYVHKEDTKESSLATKKCGTASDLTRVIRDLWPTWNDWSDEIQRQDRYSKENHLLIKPVGYRTLDKIVSHLMCLGYYGIEYIGANPSVRTTWKLYIITIMYREYATPPPPILMTRHDYALQTLRWQRNNMTKRNKCYRRF